MKQNKATRNTASLARRAVAAGLAVSAALSGTPIAAIAQGFTNPAALEEGADDSESAQVKLAVEVKGYEKATDKEGHALLKIAYAVTNGGDAEVSAASTAAAALMSVEQAGQALAVASSYIPQGAADDAAPESSVIDTLAAGASADGWVVATLADSTSSVTVSVKKAADGDELAYKKAVNPDTLEVSDPENQGGQDDALAQARAALDAAVQKAEGYTDLSAYTDESAKALTDALAAAKEAQAKTDASADELNQAASALTAAIDGLTQKPVEDKTPATTEEVAALRQAVFSSNTIFTQAYTAESNEVLASAQKTANDLLGATDPLQKDVLAATAALNDAVNGLVSINGCDVSALAPKLYKAKNITAEDLTKYTTDSASAFKTAYDNALTVATTADGITQEAVDSAATALEDAITGLTLKDVLVDTSVLEYTVKRAGLVKPDGYTDESVKTLSDAVDAAKQLLEKDEKTQDEVEGATAAINNALNSLATKSGVDAKALQSKIIDAKLLDTTGFTTESVEALNKAIAGAEAAIADEKATDETIATATKNLDDAVNGLTAGGGEDVKVDKTKLADAIEAAKKLDAKEYTEAGQKTITDAIAAAEKVRDDESADQATVDAAVKALDEAIAGAQKVEKGEVDTTKLTAAVNKAKALDLTGYTEESVDALTKAVVAAQEVAKKDGVTQDEVDAATKSVTDAIAGLVKKETTGADTTKLEEAVKKAEGIDLTGYTKASVDTFKKALAAAKKVGGDSSATQEDVDAATKALNDAIAGLKKADEDKVDTSALEKAVADAKKLDLSGYSAESKKALTDALAAAEKVLKDDKATQEDVDTATKAVNSAVAGLKKAGEADKSALAQALMSANSVKDFSYYTSDSYSAFYKALSAAKAVNEDKAASQADVDAAAKALSEAIAGLKEASAETAADKTDLNKSIELAEKVDTKNYTDDSVKVMNDALAAAKKVAADESATQDAVDVANKNLTAAMNALVKAKSDNKTNGTNNSTSGSGSAKTTSNSSMPNTGQADIAGLAINSGATLMAAGGIGTLLSRLKLRRQGRKLDEYKD